MATTKHPINVCYFLGSDGDWGGSSRALFAILKMLDRDSFHPIVLLTKEGPASQTLSEMGVKSLVWGNVTEPGDHWSYLKALIKSWIWFKQEKIDVVHMNRANDWRPAEHMAAQLARIPIITHFHTVNHDRAPATKLSKRIVAVSAYVASHSDLMGVPVTVLPNVVDFRTFKSGKSIRKELGVTEKHIVVTYAGQIRKIKGIEDFITMTALLPGQNLRFIIAGECRKNNAIPDGFNENELTQAIAADTRIVYTGYREDMPNIYASSDIIVMPSRWQEPFGLVLIEAAAANKPVVATTVGAIPEVVKQNQTGILVSSGNVRLLANAVQKLIENPVLRSEMGNAAAARVNRSFTLEPVRRLEQLYGKVARRNLIFNRES